MQLVHLRVPFDLLRKLDAIARNISLARNGAPVSRTEVIRTACNAFIEQHEAARATRCTD